MKLLASMKTSAEQFPSKVAASFDTQSEARRAANRLSQIQEVEPEQIVVIAPEDDAADQKLQPEAQAIQNSFVRKHFKYGVAGLFGGLTLSSAAVTYGPEVFAASPLLAVIAITWVTFLSSLMLAGASTLRMDHDLVVSHAQQASDQGMHLVVAHARTTPEKRRFAKQLKTEAETTVATF